MVNETVAVLRDQVENLRAELANLRARREQDMHHVESLLAERDEWRALATKARERVEQLELREQELIVRARTAEALTDERDEWRAEAERLRDARGTREAAVLGAGAKVIGLESRLAAANALLEEARDAIDEACWPVWWEKWRAYLSGTSDTNPRI